MPWTSNRVFLSISNAIVYVGGPDGPRYVPYALLRRRDDLFRRVVHVVRGREIQTAVLEHLLALLNVRPLHADDDRDAHAEVLDRGDEPFREDVAPEDAAEDVDQHRPYSRVGHQDAERVLDLFGVRAAADVEEVGR